MTGAPSHRVFVDDLDHLRELLARHWSVVDYHRRPGLFGADAPRPPPEPVFPPTRVCDALRKARAQMFPTTR